MTYAAAEGSGGPTSRGKRAVAVAGVPRNTKRGVVAGDAKVRWAAPTNGG